MEITEVRVKLIVGSEDHLKAFCTMTLDREFVVRDIKVIEGADGYFVAMPSRKISDRCRWCGVTNHLRARYCNGCGKPLRTGRVGKDAKGKAKLHADVAHPISPECRQRIQRQVVGAYEEELKRSKQPGYRLTELDETDGEVPEAIR